MSVQRPLNPDGILHPGIVWALLDAGFPRDDAEQWARSWVLIPEPALVLAHAIAYDDHGIPLQQALEWHQRGFDVGEACGYYDAHYTPVQVAWVELLIHEHDQIEDWLATGLPADRVIAHLHAGVRAHEAAAFEAIDGTGDTLGMLAAFLMT